LLLGSKQLIVVWRRSDLQAQPVWSSCQVVSADFEGDILKFFALVAVVEVRLEVEDVGGGSVKIDGDGRDDGLVIQSAGSGLIVEGLLSGTGVDNSKGKVARGCLDRSRFTTWYFRRLGLCDDTDYEDNCKEQKSTRHMFRNRLCRYKTCLQ
jgi:hypothetical protein